MRIAPFAIAAAIATAFTSVGTSAELTPELLSVCKAVFTDGSRDIYNYSSDVTRARDYFNGVCSIDASTYREFNRKRQNVDLSGDTPWGLYDFKWKEDKDGEKFKDELKVFCAQVKDEQYLREIVRTSSSTINKYLGNAFNQCVGRIASYAEEKRLDIFQTFAFQGTGGRRFSVYVAFSPANTNELLEVSSVSPDRVVCRYGGQQVRPSTILQSIRTRQDFPIDCERPENERITFTFGAKGMSTNKLDIPEWNEPVPDLRSDINALAKSLIEVRTELLNKVADLKAGVNGLIPQLRALGGPKEAGFDASAGGVRECGVTDLSETQVVTGIRTYPEDGHLKMVLKCKSIPVPQIP